MRPGRADITKMRSARNTASRKSCVTSTTVILRDACRSRITHHSSSRVKASSAPNGSSRPAWGGLERAERLVEHQQIRLVDQRAAERGALLHAAGELPWEFVALPGE